MSVSETRRPEGRPDLSLVMPCYNEEEVVQYTVNRLFEAFDGAGRRLQVIAVDNGSSDSTGDLLRRIASERRDIVTLRVEVNRGYGNGILEGIPHCTGRWAGSIPADGEVDAEDVLRLFEAADSTGGRVIAKVRRRFRMDGVKRKMVSVAYNLFFRSLWPGVGSLDINGSPKILPRDYLFAMDLESRDWCYDPEVMVKAHNMGLRVLELNIFARMRSGGTSHVRATTAWNFFSRLLAVRLFGQWRCQPPENSHSPSGPDSAVAGAVGAGT